MRKKKGFTLAELLIVVAVIRVLVAISVPIFSSQLHKAKVATDDGPKFGPNGEAGGFQRINFSCPRVQLEAALNRIAEALDAL